MNFHHHQNKNNAYSDFRIRFHFNLINILINRDCFQQQRKYFSQFEKVLIKKENFTKGKVIKRKHLLFFAGGVFVTE